jgi:hypothetical protein
VIFVTTEHFTLQGARSATISESIGRATLFLTSVSGGLVALGLVATATHVGTVFEIFGLILLPTLVFLGLVTFGRALQSGIEDHGYAVRIARLRAFYFDNAPEVTPYLASAPRRERLLMQGLWGGGWKRHTVAGMIAVITSVLAGSTAGLGTSVASASPAMAVVAGVVSGVVLLITLMRLQALAWRRAPDASMFIEETPVQ